MYLSRKLLSDGKQRYRGRASLPVIGKLFGGRDHTTVIHGIKVIERLVGQDSEERRAVGEIGLRLIEMSNV
jgi:chromosomal replication initiator protein